MLGTKIRALTLILLVISPLMHFCAYSCPLGNLNTFGNLTMIHVPHTYVEQVMMMSHTRMQLSLSYSKLFPLDGFICNFMFAP